MNRPQLFSFRGKALEVASYPNMIEKYQEEHDAYLNISFMKYFRKIV